MGKYMQLPTYDFPKKKNRKVNCILVYYTDLGSPGLNEIQFYVTKMFSNILIDSLFATQIF